MASFEPEQGHVRACHYAVLGVGRDAEEAEIRRAYRKEALRWHPDKNPDRQEEATARFREISEAYKTLSDAQERAWYDTHRESILRGQHGANGGGGNGADGGDAPDYSWAQPDLWAYFARDAYADYSDGEGGFYAVMGEAFKAVAEAERKDAERRRDKSFAFSAPTEFGTSKTNLEQVARFYQAWASFSSKMSFAWVDEYDTREAEDRFERKHVEKLNQKKRDAARKEYNKTVLAFVDHCRNRDKRYVEVIRAREAQQREKEEAFRRRLEEEKAARKREREERFAATSERRAQLEAVFEAMERAEAERDVLRLDELDEVDGEYEEGGEEGDFDEGAQEEEEEEEETTFDCGVCRKTFKSRTQLENHEASKKHKDAVKKFLAEEGGGKKKGGKGSVSVPVSVPVEEDAAAEDEEGAPRASSALGKKQMKKKNKKAQQQVRPVVAARGVDAGEEDEEEEEDAPAMAATAATAAAKSAPEMTAEELEEEAELERLMRGKEAEFDFVPASQVHSRAAAAGPAPSVTVVGTNDDEDDEVEEATATADVDRAADELEAMIDELNVVGGAPSQSQPQGKKLTAKQKRVQRQARKAETEASPELTCTVCGSSFPSRTRLFDHIREEGHAAVREDGGGAKAGKGGKGKKR